MTQFENYLVSIGFVKSRWCKDTNRFIEEKPNRHEISSMTNLKYVYVKDLDALNNNDIVERYDFGLNEISKPPTLIYPYLYKQQKLNEGYMITQFVDDEVNRLLKDLEPSELIDKIKANKGVMLIS